ncbi:MAG TPA: penicillin-binding protein activator [Burkholderiales bacterium]|nr:penicillin-binding protein activator [Burkholderiales bacterium]
MPVEPPAAKPAPVEPPAPVVIPAPEPPATPPAPAITLLLPLDAPDFRPAAEAVNMGFLAAMAAEGRKRDIVVRSSDASDESVLAQYQAAVDAGTRLVVGPMTRSGVTALVRNRKVAVPTLALNQPDGSGPLPPTLYVFGLAVDAEARQVARQAWADTMRIAAIVGTATPLSQRSREAFADEWLLLGGRVTDVVELRAGGDPVVIREIIDRNPPHFVFLAESGERARILRPYLGGQMPVYATSQVNTTADPMKNLDMNGVRFADMPWIVRPEDPEMARFPRPQGLEGDLARFYALGIDAFRIAERLVDGGQAFDFAGVTGRIAVQGGGVVERRPVAATFRDGRGVALE